MASGTFFRVNSTIKCFQVLKIVLTSNNIAHNKRASLNLWCGQQEAQKYVFRRRGRHGESPSSAICLSVSMTNALAISFPRGRCQLNNAITVNAMRTNRPCFTISSFCAALYFHSKGSQILETNSQIRAIQSSRQAERQ